jgi:hypothetical protein
LPVIVGSAAYAPRRRVDPPAAGDETGRGVIDDDELELDAVGLPGVVVDNQQLYGVDAGLVVSMRVVAVAVAICRDDLRIWGAVVPLDDALEGFSGTGTGIGHCCPN